MNFDAFFQSISGLKTEVILEGSSPRRVNTLDNEALFQLPLISLVILLLAKDKRKPRVPEIGQLVGESIGASLVGFKGSAQHVGWSANLRVRTVTALSFLELARLVEVDNRKGRVVATELGKRVINKAMNQEDNLAYNLAHISRAYRNLCVSRQLDLEME